MVLEVHLQLTLLLYLVLILRLFYFITLYAIKKKSTITLLLNYNHYRKWRIVFTEVAAYEGPYLNKGKPLYRSICLFVNVLICIFKLESIKVISVKKNSSVVLVFFNKTITRVGARKKFAEKNWKKTTLRCNDHVYLKRFKFKMSTCTTLIICIF